MKLEDGKIEFVKAPLKFPSQYACNSFLPHSNDLEQRQFLLERQILEEQILLLQTDLENSSQVIRECYAKEEALNAALQQKDYEIDFFKKRLSSIHLQHDSNKRWVLFER